MKAIKNLTDTSSTTKNTSIISNILKKGIIEVEKCSKEKNLIAEDTLKQGYIVKIDVSPVEESEKYRIEIKKLK